ncbi:hypothetical protein [Streptomyces sp. NPDC097610]|uniref:hypothetical protein n=1 Tax=Streptomyces sp. NPDC097610 TaxID=3157227 RepID=UPI0033196DAC
MTVPQCDHAPSDSPAHGAKWNSVIIVIITVVVLGGLGVSPEWLAFAAALGGVLLNGKQAS